MMGSQAATLAVDQKLQPTSCCTCGICFAIPAVMEARLRQAGGTFYCPNGHPLGFGVGENGQLKAEIERQKKLVDFARNEAAVQRAEAQRLTKQLRRRVGNGTCPCCSRSFANVKRHIKTKHPEFPL